MGDRTEPAFNVCGYSDIFKKYAVPLVDLQRDPSVSCKGSNGRYRICQSILELDRLINIPVLKGHCQAAMTQYTQPTGEPDIKGLLFLNIETTLKRWVF